MLALYRRRSVLLMLLFGFSSGLPWMLCGATLLAWLVNVGVRVGEVALFSLVSLPYSLKVLWAPLIDRFALWPQRLGRRRGWILLCQLGLLATLLLLSFCDPLRAPLRVAGLALLLAGLSATQDIAVDAYRTDLLASDEAAAGTATFVLGYRLAMVVSGALALRLADLWQRDFGRVYLTMALLLLPLLLGPLLGPDPVAAAPPPRTLAASVSAPLREFFSRSGAVRLLLFLLLYRIGDVILASMQVPFLLGRGYSNSEVADATKLVGLAASIGGVLLGGPLAARLGLRPALLRFGLLLALAHLGYAALALAPLPTPLHRQLGLYGAVAADSFCSGLCVAASGALLISLCDRRYSATQGALLTSAAGLLGRLVAGSSGLLVERWGWGRFFVLTALLSLPALLLVRRLPLTAPSRA